MIDKQELINKIRNISVDSLRQPYSTNLNNILEYALRESCLVILDELMQLREEFNVSKNGGISESERDTETKSKPRKVPATKAGEDISP
jgi:hypothetical protein